MTVLSLLAGWELRPKYQCQIFCKTASFKFGNRVMGRMAGWDRL